MLGNGEGFGKFGELWDVQPTVVKAVEVLVTKPTVGEEVVSPAFTTVYNGLEVDDKAFEVIFVMLT